MKSKKFTKLRVLINGINDACGLAIDEFEHWERSLDEMIDDELNGYVSMIIDLSEQVKATFKEEEPRVRPRPVFINKSGRDTYKGELVNEGDFVKLEDGGVYLVSDRDGDTTTCFYCNLKYWKYKTMAGDYQLEIEPKEVLERLV